MVFCTRMTDPPLSDAILQLPNLHRFAVSTTHCLKYINTLGLQEFMLHGEYDHRGPPPGEVPHIVDFLQVFQAAPSLCELTVLGRNQESMTTLIQTLSPVERAPSKLLPHLTAISLGPVADLPTDIAIDMIAARFNGVDAKVTRFRPTAPMKRLAEMQQEGLELCLVRGDKNYQAVLASDAYSVRRCAKYRNRHLTSSKIWEYV
ncbi:hypothetical protein DFH06DRAFT_1205731 [Mycena polygramma]|nr:hypothetical protein DFH06DRAFT_1205731 [Mycena polygramma]